MSNNVYQFLDDLGTQEFIDVVKEIAEENLEKSICTDIDSESTDNEMPSAKSVLSLIDQVINVINNTTGEISDVRKSLQDACGYCGITVAGIGASNIMEHLKFSFITGDINILVTNPDSSILYFQHDSEDDNTWTMYIYKDKWLVVGETKYDLLNYWSKDNDEILQEVYNRVIGSIASNNIKTKATSAYTKIVK